MNLGRVSSPLCVCMSLGWLVVEHNCVNIGVFIDFVEQQLHVSAFIGHGQVVLREVKEITPIPIPNNPFRRRTQVQPRTPEPTN